MKTEDQIKSVCEHERTKDYDGLYYCGKCGEPMRKEHDTKPILKLYGPNIQEVLKDNPPEETPPVEYLSKIQNDQKDLGERLKAVRIANGIELKDIADRTSAEHLERGDFNNISSHYLFQYAHEIGARLSCHNIL